MSITLYTTAWGDYWNKYGSSWTDNINTLDPQPDRVLIVSDKAIESEFDVVVTDVPDRAIISHFRNVAVNNSSTEWIVSLDLDDKANVDFLANLNYQAEVHTFGYLSTRGYTHAANKNIWDNMFNFDIYYYTIPSSSAIKLDAIKKCGGYPEIEYEDAGLWCKIKKANLNIHFDPTIRYLYSEEGPSLSRGDVDHKEIELNMYFQTVKV